MLRYKKILIFQAVLAFNWSAVILSAASSSDFRREYFEFAQSGKSAKCILCNTKLSRSKGLSLENSCKQHENGQVHVFAVLVHEGKEHALNKDFEKAKDCFSRFVSKDLKVINHCGRPLGEGLKATYCACMGAICAEERKIEASQEYARLLVNLMPNISISKRKEICDFVRKINSDFIENKRMQDVLKNLLEAPTCEAKKMTHRNHLRRRLLLQLRYQMIKIMLQVIPACLRSILY